MNAQEIFDIAYIGVLTQGKASIDQGGSCLYRHGDLMCAAGHVVAKCGVEPTHRFWNILGEWGDVVDDLPQDTMNSLDEYKELITDIQRAHDNSAVDFNRSFSLVPDAEFLELYKSAMRDVAYSWDLTIPEVSCGN